MTSALEPLGFSISSLPHCLAFSMFLFLSRLELWDRVVVTRGSPLPPPDWRLISRAFAGAALPDDANIVDGSQLTIWVDDTPTSYRSEGITKGRVY